MNGQSKIGARELEIIEYLEKNGEQTYTQILVNFSPVAPSFGGKSYSQYSVVEARLWRMKKKGLISIEKRGFERVVKLAATVCDEHIGIDD